MNVRTLSAIALGLMGAFALAGSGMTRDEVLKAEGYIKPSAEIEKAVMAPWNKNVMGGSLNSQKTHMLITDAGGLVGLEALGRNHRILGGMAIDLVAERDRDLTIRSLDGMSVIEVATGAVIAIQLPKGVEANGPRWSPDGLKIAFVGVTERETSLYVADAKTGKVKKVMDGLRMTEVTSMDWLADSKRVVVPVRPEGLKMPVFGQLPMGPKVRNSDVKPDPLRTWQSMLETPEDIALLKYLLTAQIGIVDTDNGRMKRIGEPRMLMSVDAGPFAKGFIVNEHEGEFSYLFPASSMATKRSLLDENGKEVAVLAYSGRREVPIKKEDQPITRTGLQWRPDGAGLSYLRDEELPKDSKEKAKKQLVLWKAPFGKDDIEVVFEQADAFSLVGYGSDEQSVVISKVNGKKTEFSVFKLGDKTEPKKVWETSSDTDFYSSPGTLMFETKPGFGRVVRMSADAGSVFLSGTRYFKNPEELAPRPFVDRLKLDGEMKPERLWESSADAFESVDMLDDGTKWLINRQSATMMPQIFFKSGSSEKQLTNNVDYLPEISGATRKRIVVTRADGFKFHVNVTIPAGAYKAPAFFWFYPTEYTDQKVYDESQRTHNKNRFPVVRSSSPEILLKEGYVVVDPECPITGSETEANNTFTHQLRNNLSAIIDALAEEGWIDRNKLSIGGHSYGAFGTATALIHTPFFKAGIAGAGNYNRSYTPFGFQREPRSLWVAREMYQDISAVWHAEKLTGALLMYHGMQDQNMGTFPEHSERMFMALEALGKPAALYMYPFEDHGQIAMETRLDMWARWIAWLDKWVKNPDVPKQEESKPEGGIPPLAWKVDLQG